MAAALLLPSCNKSPKEPAEISVTPSTVSFSGDGETINVAVSVKGASEWAYTGTPEWITVETDGNSMALTAAPNTPDGPRTAVMTLTAGDAETTLELSQAKGPKYPGFTELAKAEIEFAGTMYQLFGFPDCEGSQFIITLDSDDSRQRVILELFTEQYASEEEVTLSAGKYTAGDDYSSIMKQEAPLAGKPMTWMKGGQCVISDEDGEEGFSGGTMLKETTGEQEEEYYMTDGTVEISYDDKGAICIKCSFKDSEGTERKYYYEGEYELLLEGAFYPSAEVSLMASMLTYLGDTEDAAKSNFQIMLATTDMTIVNIDFFTTKTDAKELNIAGTYKTSDKSMTPGFIETYEEEGETYNIPSGTYWSIAFIDNHIADDESEMTIAKNEDGTFDVSFTLKEKAGNELSFDLSSVAFEVIDYTEDIPGED